MELLEQTILLANSLLMQYCIPRIVYQIADCDSVTFVALFESITRSLVPSVNRLPSTGQEHTENYALLIAQVSSFLPRDLNLDHIDPSFLAAHDTLSIHNLLELMSVLGEIITENSQLNQFTHATPSPLFAEPPIYPNLVPGLSPDMKGIPMSAYTTNTDEMYLDHFRRNMENLNIAGLDTDARITSNFPTNATQPLLPSISAPESFQLFIDSPSPAFPNRGVETDWNMLSHHTSLESIEIISLAPSQCDGDEIIGERPLSPLPSFQVEIPSDTEEVPQLSITELENVTDTLQSPILPPQVVILNRPNGHNSPIPHHIVASDSDIFPRAQPQPTPFSPLYISSIQSPGERNGINSLLISEDSLAHEMDPNKTLSPLRKETRNQDRTENLANINFGDYQVVKGVHQEIFAPMIKGKDSGKSPYLNSLVPKSSNRIPSKPLKSPGKLQRSAKKKDKVQFSQSTDLREEIREFAKELHRERPDDTVTSFEDTSPIQVDESGIKLGRRAESKNASVRRDILRAMYRKYWRDVKQSHKSGEKRERPNGVYFEKEAPQRYDNRHSSPLRYDTIESELSFYEPPDTKTIRTDDNLFPMIKREFPYMELSPTTSRRLWKKQMRQIESLTKSVQPTQSKQYRELQEAERRQVTMIDVLNKDLRHAKRMRELQQKAHSQQTMKSQLREQRAAQVKSKQYYKEYELKMKSRLQKKRTKEEVVFQKIFEDALDIQKARVRELKHFAKEQQSVQLKKQQDALESLENYYRDRFSLLTERISQQTRDETRRQRNENLEVKRMRREVRHKLEGEIEKLQECIDDAENDTHFRELDAMRFRDKLRAATFLAPIK